jgi:hypothetical protein
MVEDTEIREGFVSQSFEGRDRKFNVQFVVQINCGFPAYPKKGDWGLFFLRVDNPDHEDDQEYDILHFEVAEAVE